MRIGLGMTLAVLLSLPRICAAQTSGFQGPPPLPRWYVDVNVLGYGAPLGDGKTFQGYAVKFGELATFKASYPEPSQAGAFPVYVGGGSMFSRILGVGASYSRMSRDSMAFLTATVPDPFFYNTYATDVGTTGTTLSRNESAIHVSIVAVPVRSSRQEFRLMVGPSFFMLRGDMVREVEYEQTFSDLEPQNAVTVSGLSTGKASGSGIGYHMGADYTYFVHRIVGLTGGIRYSQAIVGVDNEPLSKIKQDFLVGSTTVFFGLRFRLGK